MKVLLDTHALVWWWLDARTQSPFLRDHFAEVESVVSAVSLWEMATKYRLGKWPELEPIISNIGQELEHDGIDPMPITWRHASAAGSYPAAHRDPFDRLLAAQAELEGLVLVTCDDAFRAFPCATRW